MADKIKRIKSDKREANKQAKLAQEEKDRPKIESLRLLWDRFAAARAQAKKSVKEFYEAVGMYYTSTSPKEVQQLESGEAKIGASTRTPFGYNIRLTEVDMLVKAADLFDCSIDYLLGRTDIREMASPEVAMPDATMIWHPISEEPPAGVDLIWVDNRGYCDTAKYMGFQKISIVSTISWDEARYWAYPPEKLDKE